MNLSSIRIWHKLLFLGVVALVLCAVPTVLYVRGANKEIRDALTEVSGLAPAAELVRIMQPLQSHRGLSAATLSGDQALVSQRASAEKEVTAAFVKARASIPRSAAPVIASFDKAEAEWKSLSAALKDKSFPVEETYNRHTKLMASLLKLLEINLDYFGLTLDPEANSYHLIIAAFDDLPRLTEAMGRLRAAGGAILAIKQATTEERVTIATMLERTRDDLESSRARIRKAIDANGGNMPKLETASIAALQATQKLIAVSDLEFIRIEVLRYDASEYLKLASVAVDAQFNLIDSARGEIEQILRARVTSKRWVMAGLLGLIAVLLVIGAAAMFLMARSIVRPLTEAIGDANAIAAGHLDAEIVNIGLDEVGQLRRAMRHMQRNLAQIVVSIRENSESLSSAAREIASSTQDMSNRTESQASSLEQTAASMEELQTTFHQNDESSQHVSDLAAKAAEAAEQGGVVVGKVTNTMQEIDISSKKIAEIISVIDSIAFQTNILALNAAVEAARAGEQGRGFAVVATEVRALAQRSSVASKEIRTLIAESVKKVQTGTREAAESGKAMDDILASVRKVTTTMTDMQAVRGEQRHGVSQVSRAVEHMNQGTQQSAAMVEQIAATAEQLSAQAEELSEAVAAFTLKGEGRHKTTAAPDANTMATNATNATNAARIGGITKLQTASPQPSIASPMRPARTTGAPLLSSTRDR